MLKTFLTQEEIVLEHTCTSSWKAQYTINEPSNKIQSKDEHWNYIQYELEVKDDQYTHLITRYRKKNSSMTPKKTVFIINAQQS